MGIQIKKKTNLGLIITGICVTDTVADKMWPGYRSTN